MKVELKENIKFTSSNIPFAPSYKPGLVTKTQAGEMKTSMRHRKVQWLFPLLPVLPRWRNFKTR